MRNYLRLTIKVQSTLFLRDGIILATEPPFTSHFLQVRIGIEYWVKGHKYENSDGQTATDMGMMIGKGCVVPGILKDN